VKFSFITKFHKVKNFYFYAQISIDFQDICEVE